MSPRSVTSKARKLFGSSRYRVSTDSDSAKNNRKGFTLVELLISLLIALVVVSSATAFTVSTWQARRNWTVREGVDRNARFIGMAIARDAQEAGVALQSSTVFASVDAKGDTLSILSVPYEPNEAPVYSIWNDGDTAVFYPPEGNCGNHCIRFNKTNGAYTVQAGDLALLQVGSERRLLYLEGVSNQASNRFQVQVKNRQRLLGRQSGLSDSIRLARTGTTLQEVRAVVYWRDPSSQTLYRAQRFNSNGDPIGEVIATGVEEFNVRLLFIDGSEAPQYNGFDADTLNDGNKIIGIRVEAVIKADKTDPAVNKGEPVRRQYEWRVAPRNLLYEKNRT